METTAVLPAVIEEARRRQRRRRLAAAAFALAAVSASIGVAVTNRGSGAPSTTTANSTAPRALIGTAAAHSGVPEPRQAIELTTIVKRVRGREWIGLGFDNVSGSPAMVRISVKGRPPLTRGEVVLNASGERFRNGTVLDPLPANHVKPFLDLALVMPKDSTGSVEVDLVRDFGSEGPPFSQIASIGFGPS